MELFFSNKGPCVLLSTIEMIDEASQVARCSILLFCTTALTDSTHDLVYFRFNRSMAVIDKRRALRLKPP